MYIEYNHSSLGNIYFTALVFLGWQIKDPAMWSFYKYPEEVCYEKFFFAEILNLCEVQ